MTEHPHLAFEIQADTRLRACFVWGQHRGQVSALCFQHSQQSLKVFAENFSCIHSFLDRGMCSATNQREFGGQ